MHILSFDIEEWFHLLDNDSTKTEHEWNQYESRISEGLERILNILDNHKQKATFFILGWIAEKHPHVVKNILDAGHEIGSHSRLHQLAYEQSPEEFSSDLDRSIKVLEDISGSKVRYYRCPGFSITQKNLWALDKLIQAGIEVDCSIFPAGRAHGGLPSFGEAQPCTIQLKSGTLREFPINTYSLFGKNIIFSGGGYFRILPYSFIRHMTKNSPYVMTYFHPRDFDANQPMVPNLPLPRKFKSYVGLKGALNKLDKYLNDFKFVSLSEAENEIQWNHAPCIHL